MPTISDVAKRAGVSTYTVSAVLNRSAKVSPELTGRVLKAVTDLDYTINYVARSLQTRKTETIGMLIPDIGNQTYAAVLRGVEDVVNEHGYSLLLGSTHNRQADQDRGLAVYRAKQVDGMLLFIAGDESAVQSLVQKKIPVVCVGRRPATFVTDSVISDHKSAARIATDHLVSHGHKKIALITGHAAASVAKDSIAGWKAGLKQAGLTPDSDYLIEGDWDPDHSYQQALALLSSAGAPSAILATNVFMVIGILRAARELKLKVPEHVELMSTSDSPWLDAFEPRISAVCHSNYDMGSGAAQLLFKRIAEPEREFEQIVLKPNLKIR